MDQTTESTAIETTNDQVAPAGASIARGALASLRPQPFGNGNPARIRDPLIEPTWPGIRALAAVDGGDAVLADEAGEPIDQHSDVVSALIGVRLAEQLVLDGYLTKMTARDRSGVYVAMDDLPTASQLVSRPVLGIRRNHAEDMTRAMEAERLARTFDPADVVSFVAIDILLLDGEPLLDVPLLERRRLLDSALGESELVRRGVFVRPPVDRWIGSWRALGFTGLTFRAANSRYQPGIASDDWASTPMPRR